MFYERKVESILLNKIKEPRRFINVLLGPRQVGKTTIAESIFRHFQGEKKIISADDPGLNRGIELNDVWKNLSQEIKKKSTSGLLIIDEIHKYPDWEKAVKSRWDEDTRNKIDLKILILGSAPLLIQKGLTESLAGRFELTEISHWHFLEMKAAFSLSVQQFIYFGSYPGSAALINDEPRWKSYIKNSLIETTISRDVLLLTRVDKPALLRQLFYLATQYSGQILSYQKMMGQLQDAGNTTTLAHYLDLLDAVGFVRGLKKYTGSAVLTRSSSPKLQVYNMALMSAMSSESFHDVQSNPALWGRFCESAVGAELLNKAVGTDIQIEYWKEGNFEVDFVLKKGKLVVGLEVKSGKKRESISGLEKFREKFAPVRTHIVGTFGISYEDFFKMGIEDFF